MCGAVSGGTATEADVDAVSRKVARAVDGVEAGWLVVGGCILFAFGVRLYSQWRIRLVSMPVFQRTGASLADVVDHEIAEMSRWSTSMYTSVYEGLSSTKQPVNKASNEMRHRAHQAKAQLAAESASTLLS